MKLYDIYYHGNSMDSSMPFPKTPSADIERIVNTNQEGDTWTVRREIDHDMLVRLIREARESSIDPTKARDYEADFREALGGKCAPFRAVSSDGEAEWVPSGYPLEDARRKLAAYWVSVGKPELTSLQFVELH